ncbi:hypothetical protein Vau01_044650 [Virgisporangium aurantiacum]|uniref:Uncharacterized protein n=1 Tax=Virgisporangium aurantiacum TaxID=175570 RepID=A0A8J4E0G2_9ACTN|nr:hypothetical protein Vau01_044650 [Virgisporangium aurantiacum]
MPDFNSGAARCASAMPLEGSVVPDVVFVVLTVVLFAVLALAVRAVEKR